MFIKLLLPQQKSETWRLIGHDKISGANAFDKLRAFAAETIDFPPESIKLDFVNTQDGCEFAITNNVELIDAMAFSKATTQTCVTCITIKAFHERLENWIEGGPSFIKIFESSSSAPGACRLLSVVQVFSDREQLPLAKLRALASEAFGLSIECVGLTFSVDGSAVELLSEVDLSNALAFCKEDALSINVAPPTETRSQPHKTIETTVENEGDGTSVGDVTDLSNSKDMLPAFVKIQEGTGEETFRFDTSLVCDGVGSLSYSRVASLVAGVFHAHPSRVELRFAGQLVANDTAMKENLVACTSDELHLTVTFKKPDQLKVLFPENDTFLIVGGETCLVTLRSMAAVKFNGGPITLEMLGTVIQGDNDLLAIVRNSPDHCMPEIVATPQKLTQASLLPGTATLTGSQCAVATNQESPSIQVLYSDAVASWELPNLVPGRYKATLEYKHMNCDSSVYAGVVAKGTDLANRQQRSRLLGTTRIPSTANGGPYSKVSTDPFELSTPDCCQFVVAQNDCNGFYLRSVELENVGPN